MELGLHFRKFIDPTRVIIIHRSVSFTAGKVIINFHFQEINSTLLNRSIKKRKQDLELVVTAVQTQPPLH